MAFRKLLSEKTRIRVTAPTGDKVTAVKGWKYIDGEYVYTVKELDPHYERTQAARDSVDLHKIIERYRAGDTDALNRVTGSYIDTVNMPKTIGELYDAVSNAQMVFDSMPIEIKNQFDNNPAAFYKAYGSFEEFDKKMNDYVSVYKTSDDPVNTSGTVVPDVVDTVPTVVEKEVKTNESE